MTKSDIISLEWALERLPALDDGSEEFSDHIARLTELRWEYYLKYVELQGDKTSLIAFMRKYAITIPMARFDQWRMMLPQQQRMGEIEGLPESRGILRCTDGVECYIERVGAFPYLGHIQHWTPDATESTGRIFVTPGSRKAALKRDLAALFHGGGL